MHLFVMCSVFYKIYSTIICSALHCIRNKISVTTGWLAIPFDVCVYCCWSNVHWHDRSHIIFHFLSISTLCSYFNHSRVFWWGGAAAYLIINCCFPKLFPLFHARQERDRRFSFESINLCKWIYTNVFSCVYKRLFGLHFSIFSRCDQSVVL